MNISRYKARLWAAEHKTYVFKWENILRKEENTPCKSDMRNHIMEANSFFWQYSVPGAPTYITTNINPALGVVNGCPSTQHSLTFSDPEEHDRVMSLISGPTALPFGSEITIKTPHSVNILINPCLDSRPMSSKRKRQLQQLKPFSILPTLDDPENFDNIVIPITTTMRKDNNRGSDKKRRFYYETGNLITPYASAVVIEPFPFELAFAMTVHKAQGRTIHRLVVDLNDHPTHAARMEFAAVFVAMSRVREAKHIRLLPRFPRGSPFDMIEAYGYLCSLRPEKYVAAFYHGYPAPCHGFSWNKLQALQYTGLQSQ
jgi:hypothetical protein